MTKKKTPAGNSTYPQAGVSCFVGQESSIFEVQFFVESSVVIAPAWGVAANRYRQSIDF